MKELVVELLHALKTAANDVKHYGDGTGYGKQSVVMKAITKAERFLKWCDAHSVKENLHEAAAEEVFQYFKHVKPRLNRSAIGLICETYRKIVAKNLPPQLDMVEILKHMATQTIERERGGIEEIPRVHTFESTVTGAKQTMTFPGSAFNKQEGGDHYRNMKNQPFAFVRDNNVGHAEGEAIYRLLRWRDKGGIDDLRKVIHTVELIIEYEEKHHAKI